MSFWRNAVVGLFVLWFVGCFQIGRQDDVIARVGQTDLFESDLEYALENLHPVAQKEPDARESAFRRLLERNLLAEAGRRDFPNRAAYVDSMLKSTVVRHLSQVYQQEYLGKNMGHSEDQLLAYYRKHQKEFVQDSGKTSSFLDVHDSIVRRMVLEENPQGPHEYFVNNNNYFGGNDSSQAAFEKNRALAEDGFLQEYRKQLMLRKREELPKKYGIEEVALPQPSVEEFYQQHSDRYQIPRGYVLSHVELSDSMAALEGLKKITDEASFAEWASQTSLNEHTKAEQGKIGLVRAGHCLPWGIGMMPELFNTLEQDSVGSGMLKRVFYGFDSKTYHVFWVHQVFPQQLKPLDRARKSVEADLNSFSKGQVDEPLDSNFVLATIQGKPLIYERDILTLRREIPSTHRSKYNRARLLGYLMEWEIYSREAKFLNLDRSRSFTALQRARQVDLWSGIYRDNVLYQTLEQDVEAMKAVFQENPDSIFKNPIWEQSQLDVALWLELPDIAYQREFLFNPERYPGAEKWQDVRTKIFTYIKGAQVRAAQERLKAKLAKDLQVEIFDSSLAAANPFVPENLIAYAKQKYEKRKLVEAQLSLQNARDLLTDDTLAMRATTLLAQIYHEQQRHIDAVREFRLQYALWPDHPEAYKALFMRGFILTENLQKDSLALEAFEELLAKYPKSDLADDAAWMVKNIKSGGQLVPALLDSIAKQDSLTKTLPPGKPATAPRDSAEKSQ